MNSFEYVASGCSYLRILFPEAFEDKECKTWINDAFQKMQEKGKNHSFSLLFNAWTEKGFGEKFKEHYTTITYSFLCLIVLRSL